MVVLQDRRLGDRGREEASMTILGAHRGSIYVIAWVEGAETTMLHGILHGWWWRGAQVVWKRSIPGEVGHD
jgi:hypothetical protein